MFGGQISGGANILHFPFPVQPLLSIRQNSEPRRPWSAVSTAQFRWTDRSRPASQLSSTCGLHLSRATMKFIPAVCIAHSVTSVTLDNRLCFRISAFKCRGHCESNICRDTQTRIQTQRSTENSGWAILSGSASISTVR